MPPVAGFTCRNVSARSRSSLKAGIMTEMFKRGGRTRCSLKRSPSREGGLQAKPQLRFGAGGRRFGRQFRGGFRRSLQRRQKMPVQGAGKQPAHPQQIRHATKDIFRRKGAIASVEKGINVACQMPITMVVTTSPSSPPPMAHKTELLPRLVGHHAEPDGRRQAATGHGIEPMILLFSIMLRL